MRTLLALILLSTSVQAQQVDLVLTDGGTYTLQLSRLLTTDDQSFDGRKTFNDGLVCGYSIQQIIRAYSSGGVTMQSNRGRWDPNADFEVTTLQLRADGQLQRWVNNGTEVARVDYAGSFTGSTTNSTDPTATAFLDLGGTGSSMACAAAGGCQLTFNGGMQNKSFHGAVTIGNNKGNPLRDGGLMLQVQGIGKSNASGQGTTTLASDVYGNLNLNDGLYGDYVAQSDFEVCSNKVGFDNPPDDGGPGGSYNGNLGNFGYDKDNAVLKVCTAQSMAGVGDGGYERVCTDRNDMCGASALILLQARVSALEAHCH